MPEDFTTCTFVPIPKITETTECAEHRTISLISHCSKILLQIVLRRIEPIVNRALNETQMDFRKNKSTRDAIYSYMLRTIQERYLEKGKKVYFCFIDYTKAFDRIDYVKLMEITKVTGIPSHELRFFTDLYKN